MAIDSASAAAAAQIGGVNGNAGNSGDERTTLVSEFNRTAVVSRGLVFEKSAARGHITRCSGAWMDA
jgi:hypothetical protein